MAINIKPDDAESYKLLGDVYREKKDFASAIGQYKRALRIEPDSYGANLGLAYTYLDSGKSEDAVAQFIISIRLNPSETGAYFGLANTYNRLGWTDDEIDIYVELLDIELGLFVHIHPLVHGRRNEHRTLDNHVKCGQEIVCYAGRKLANDVCRCRSHY